MSALSKTRRDCYRCASILGDVQALASGDPAKIAKRVCRKCLWRKGGSLMNSLFR